MGTEQYEALNMFCQQCSTVLRDGAGFCQSCGAATESAPVGADARARAAATASRPAASRPTRRYGLPLAIGIAAVAVIAAVALLWVVKWPASLFQAGSYHNANVSLEIQGGTVRGSVGGDDIDLTATSSEPRVMGSVGSHEVDIHYTNDASRGTFSGFIDGRAVTIGLGEASERPVVVDNSFGDLVFDWEEGWDEAAGATVVIVNGTFDEDPLSLRSVANDTAEAGAMSLSVNGSARGEPVSLEITRLDNGFHYAGACFDGTTIDVDVVSMDNEAGDSSIFIEGSISGDRMMVGTALVGVAFLWSRNLGSGASSAEEQIAADIAKYEAAVEASPEDVAAMKGLGDTYVTRANQQEPRSDAQRADWNLAVEQYEKAVTILAQEKGTAAQTQHIEALKQVADVHLMAAQVLGLIPDLQDAAAQQYQKASMVYARITALRPDDAAAFFDWASIAINAGDTDTARLAFSKFLELAPDSPDAPDVKKWIEDN
jgi:tetratricopeptide (TPR) repeat protein